MAIAMELIPIVAAVDDDFRVRESIKSLLESAGYAPVVFSSGEEFLESGTLAAATCVITDVRMPGMDGIELQRRIRLERPALPVILISGHHDAQVRQTAIDEGAVAVLYKPFDATDLLKTVQSALSEGREK
ncbi:MAG TPA: response regulator [Bryobacteraceae bacterium]|nr:response regulator [Bryobacteraceae bacterium]